MDYKVKTLYPELFKQTCLDLRKKVESSGFHPEAIIAIPRAGLWIQDAAWTDFPQIPVKLIRPSKGKFKKRVSWIIKRLPIWLRDGIRIWEARKLIKRKEHMATTGIVLPTLSENIRKILIIDDAVDSGATLKAIVEKFKAEYPNTDIRSAVITQTHPQAIYKPDYCIFDNSTLIRTPWSIDMR
ncbi:MAG: phosphoribosyltransferase domain-containing protein [Muribaculaceae bacterium]|nr:phosphoribosyltransferase domain-containing protein [Muribaculaceae bacterium]MDE5593976.1 phosphoribosyltransferase domain-containing protein [Muribaculaceae bacterium]